MTAKAELRRRVEQEQKNSKMNQMKIQSQWRKIMRVAKARGKYFYCCCSVYDLGVGVERTPSVSVLGYKTKFSNEFSDFEGRETRHIRRSIAI